MGRFPHQAAVYPVLTINFGEWNHITGLGLWSPLDSLKSYLPAGTACAGAYSSAGGSTQRPLSFISWIKASVARSISIPRLTTFWNTIQLLSSSSICWAQTALSWIEQSTVTANDMPTTQRCPSTTFWFRKTIKCFKNNHSTASLNWKKWSCVKMFQGKFPTELWRCTSKVIWLIDRGSK